MSWMLSIRLPLEISRTNRVKKRYATWLAKQLAMMKARRSGSAMPAVSRASEPLKSVCEEDGRELLPERGVHRLGQLEDLAGGDALREEADLFREAELRRVAPFHEPSRKLSETSPEPFFACP